MNVTIHFDVPRVGDHQTRYQLRWAGVVPYSSGDICHGQNPGPFIALMAAWSIADDSGRIVVVLKAVPTKLHQYDSVTWPAGEGAPARRCVEDYMRRAR